MAGHSDQKSPLERARLSFGGSSSAARILNALTFALKWRSNSTTADKTPRTPETQPEIKHQPRPSPASWRGRHTERRKEEHH